MREYIASGFGVYAIYCPEQEMFPSVGNGMSPAGTIKWVSDHIESSMYTDTNISFAANSAHYDLCSIVPLVGIIKLRIVPLDGDGELLWGRDLSVGDLVAESVIDDNDNLDPGDYYRPMIKKPMLNSTHMSKRWTAT